MEQFDKQLREVTGCRLKMRDTVTIRGIRTREEGKQVDYIAVSFDVFGSQCEASLDENGFYGGQFDYTERTLSDRQSSYLLAWTRLLFLYCYPEHRPEQLSE